MLWGWWWILLRKWVAALALLAVACTGAAAAAPGLRVTAQQRDLTYVVRKLELHPSLIFPGKLQAFMRFAHHELRQALMPLPGWQVVELADHLTAYFHDPHTHTYLEAEGPADTLPLTFFWTGDGLVAVRTATTPATIRTGDQVLAFSGVSPRTIARRLSALWAEDRYSSEAYGATMLSSATVLHAVGGVAPGGRVALRLRWGSGKPFTVDLPLALGGLGQSQTALTTFTQRYLLPDSIAGTAQRGPFWAWTVTPRYGFFLLQDCTMSGGYLHAVTAFFASMARARSPILVIDLQQNGGGDSNVILPWLEHLPRKFKASDVNLLTSAGKAENLPAARPIFRGRVYVLQSGFTFSSAMWFTQALTGPGLGERVGTTIGEPTSGCGNVKAYTTPEFRIPFQVSQYCYAAIKGQARRTLPAQVPLALTVRDVEHGVNPVQLWLAALP